jgi:GNAT superfamily N-acetyltransferase
MKLNVSETPGSALRVMEEALRGGEPLASEFPLVFGEDSQALFITAGEELQVHSACAVLVRDLITPAGGLRVGLIGSVSTAEEERGRGLASAVLERAERELAERGCALSLLWAEDARFYERRGYQEVSAERDFVLTVEQAKDLPGTEGVRPATAEDYDRMHQLYRAHSRRVERSAAESEKLFATPGMRVLVHEERGSLDAYACYERGGDLAQVVHEWAGSTPGVLSCVRSLLEEPSCVAAGGALYLMAPADAGALGAALDELSAPSVCGILGMAKLLRPEALLTPLCESASRKLEVRQQRPDSWELAGPSGSVELCASELLQLVLAPRAERHAVQRVEACLGLELHGLPWTPFVWGLDSI